MYVYDMELHLTLVSMDTEKKYQKLHVVSKEEMVSIALEPFCHKGWRARKEQTGSIKSKLAWFRREQGLALSATLCVLELKGGYCRDAESVSETVLQKRRRQEAD